MHQPIGSSPYSPESSSHSSNSPLSNSYSSRNSPVMSASPNSIYLGNSPNPGANRSGRNLPCLSILNQPQGKFRFRYASEMTGTHGCLMAESKERNKKEYIRVQLEGCQEREAIIRCTLVTNSPKPVPHVHRLGGEGSSNGNEGEYQEMVVSANKNDWIATFSGLTIIHTAKKQVREVVERRLLNETGSVPLNRSKGQQLKDEADKIANSMDLHSVKLKFEAFVDRNGYRERITAPEYSQAIHNLKSTHAGDLRIVRIDKVYSCCTGQEEIFIFVEKVNKKDIKIRFFETDENDQEIWFAFADFSELDVHHQYAIAFKTPAYQDQNIQSDVTVYFQLYRPSNQSTSEAKSFTYTPRERVGIKRPRRDIPLNSDSHINKREYNPNRTSSQDDHSNSITSLFRPNCVSGEKDGAQDISGTLRQHQITCLEDIVDSNYVPFQTQSIISPFNSILMNGPSMEQQWSTLSPAPIQYPHSIDQQLPRPHLPPRTASDDLLKIAVDSGFAPFEQENLVWPEINLEQVDDIMLEQLLKLDDHWSSDASGSTRDGLASKLKHMTLSQNTFKESKPSIKTHSPVSYSLRTSAFMSTYSMNMARAVRWYASTGDLAHILVRMRHLLAIQSDDGDNALHDALIHSQMDVIRAILHAASYHNKELEFINARNNAELAPLHIAVLKNHTEATALLLQNGANPNMADANGNTPLHLASMDKHLIDCLQLILNTSPRRKSTHALNLNARNYAGQTPLHIAVNAKNTKSVELLLEKGVDVNCQEIKCGRSALHTAVKNRSKEILTLLLRCPSVNVNIQSYDGSTALHLAVMDELDDICALLISYGADPNILNYLDSRTTSDSEDLDENHEELDAENLSEDSPGEKGQSPLDLAQRSLTMLKLLQGGIIRSELENLELTSKEKTPDNTSQNKVLDSGIDLMTSKEIQKDLDNNIIEKVSVILDSPEKKWEKLADSLGLLSSMKSVLDQQASPATYLLSNIDLWDVSVHIVVEKLHALQIKDAAELLEEYLAT